MPIIFAGVPLAVAFWLMQRFTGWRDFNKEEVSMQEIMLTSMVCGIVTIIPIISFLLHGLYHALQ
jgi:hypothetical protein